MHTPFRQSFVAATAPLEETHRAQPATPSPAPPLAPPRRLGARVRHPGALTLCAVLALALTAFAAAPAVATERTLYVFPESGVQGCYPGGTLFRAATGALYGTTWLCGAYNHGTVFQLKPPALGRPQWTLAVLYTFRGEDGDLPNAGLVMDTSGTLYGTSQFGGRNDSGVVFKLTPPAPGQSTWQKSVLHSFTGPEGAYPQGGVIADAAGHLYGTASGGGHGVSLSGDGVVFKLTRPAPGQTRWTATVLHYFDILSSGQMPIGELVAAPTGPLFGVAYHGGQGLVGTVFQVTP